MHVMMGWEVKEINVIKRLVSIWYIGNPLPTDEEYDQHILDKYKNIENDQSNDSLNSENDSESDVC